MMLRFRRLIVFTVALLRIVGGQKVGSTKVGVPSIVGFGCFNCADYWNFGCGPEKVTKPCRCNNTEFIGTVLNCINRYSSGQEDILWGYSYVQTFCYYFGSHEFTGKELDAIHKNASNFLVDPPTTRDNNTRLYSPIDVSEKTFRNQYNAAATAKNQYRLGTVYGASLLIYWGLVVSIASALRFLECNYPEILNRFNGPLINKFRKNICLPALVHKSHMTPVRILRIFHVTASTRGQSIILFGYLALNAIFLCIHYQTYLPNPYLTETMDQLLKYIGNRTGIMAFTQMPLMVLFAARNNPLERYTGWSLNTFQVYHHWASRVVVLHAVIHSICFTWLAVESHTVGFRWMHIRNWRFGNIAAYTSILMLLIALRAFRMRFYETFVICHRVFFVIFLVGVWMHCTDFGWMAWVYTTVATYCGEYFMRFAKMIYSGMICSAVCTINSDGTIRVGVKYSKRWNIKAGQFVYIRVIKKNLFWQAHPFTIFESPMKYKAGEIQLHIKPKGGATRRLLDLLAEEDYAEEKVVKVIVEGPYGTAQPLDQYKSILLICGGIGITACYSYASSLIAKSQLEHNMYSITFIWVMRDSDSIDSFKDEVEHLIKHRHIINLKLFQTERAMDFEMLATDLKTMNLSKVDEILVAPPKATRRASTTAYSAQGTIIGEQSKSHLPVLSKCQIRNPGDSSFLTQTKESTTDINGLFEGGEGTRISESEMFGATDESSIEFLPIKKGRPDIGEEVKRFLEEGTDGTSSVLTCGPPQFVDEVRYSVVSHIEECSNRVDYFEESFSW